LGAFEEGSELPARAEARCAVRPLQVHVPHPRIGWVQAGSGTDPRLRHLRQVHASPHRLSSNARRLTDQVARQRPPAGGVFFDGRPVMRRRARPGRTGPAAQWREMETGLNEMLSRLWRVAGRASPREESCLLLGPCPGLASGGFGRRIDPFPGL